MQKTNTYKILIHLLIWGIFVWLSFEYLKNWLPQVGLAIGHAKLWVYCMAYTAVLSLAPYLSYFVLLPKFFFRKKYRAYSLWMLTGFVVVSYAVAGVDALFLLPNKPAWILTNEHIFSRLPYLILFTLLANWSRLSEELYLKQKQETELQNAKTEAELRWLKAQINPHFLFNALNNIYSLVYLKSDKAAPMLLKLSDMMRYLFQDSQTEKIAFRKEIEYLENYIQFQSLKKRWQDKISFEKNIQTPERLIEPMLFINFIENAFKHGNLDKNEAFVIIKLSVTNEKICFSIENSYQHTGTKDKTGGIGLENIIQRLLLLYPEKHELKIKKEGNVYKVELVIF